ncbi:DUF2267 domain-containing protein [Spirulina major]|uniref:DUF2267 domain-containing protein n=1 Tax=Spirulina major TaxID=270636 RepID=UPI0009354AE4|nr:DUF2267 domain-containing protein [Spirulina major]
MTAVTMNAPEKAFLEKVMQRADLPDIYDARDITLVVFRTLRDMMTTQASDRVQAAFSDDEIANLWKDDNPIVALLSRIRPPLDIDADSFIRRVSQEAGLPRGTTANGAVIAVFSTVREELPPARIQEIAAVLPSGIRILWEQV